MTDPLFEIKLLASLDHAQFEEAIWTFEIDGDISTLLLIRPLAKVKTTSI
ncbi:hypothetical protein ACG9X8_18475 [Acinetobacter nosocomialis]